MSIITIVLVASGLFFLAASALGILRFPDVFARIHAVSTSETLGMILVFVGLLFHPDINVPSALRLVMVLTFALIANTTAAHALARAARRSGHPPWTRTGSEP